MCGVCTDVNLTLRLADCLGGSQYKIVGDYIPIREINIG